MKRYYFIVTLLLFFLLAPEFFAKADESTSESLKPVYAFWKKAYSYRYFPISAAEQKDLNSGSDWKNEGIFWYAYEKQEEETVPVFKLKNNTYNYYYYTISESEKNTLTKAGTKEWTDRGIAFYAYSSEKDGRTPVYALSNSKTNKYFYTSSSGEKNCKLTDSTWIDKGTIFWVPKENANISKDESACKVSFGPEISVGLWESSTKDAEKNAFTIKANKKYLVKDGSGNILGKISAGTATKVKYSGNKKLTIYGPLKETRVTKEVSFEAYDGKNDLMIFDANRPNSSYDQYRGKIKIRYSDTSKSIWVINTLPMEHYVWGMGETTGTGDIEHTKVMTTIFRTYGYWYLEYATKYLPYGFQIKSDSGSQIYNGYDWEAKYPNIKKAADGTKGAVAKYKNEIALTPYSSWSDGKTRSFEERWGSDEYPWCKSVSDPYGKHSTMATAKLEAAGNHMVGLVANGSVKLASSKYKKTYDWILKYYYSKISLEKMY